MNWSKEWKTPPVWPQKQEGAAALPKPWGLGVENVIAKEVKPKGDWVTHTSNHVGLEEVNIFKGIPLANKVLEKYDNLKPTHDPYTNPNAYLYYECSCEARLDPHVKSFAALNNAAMNSEWKIRWGANGYVPYCVKCGEGVE